MCYLYKHWDKNDNLLYVGISLSAVARLKQHSRKADWYDKIAKITIEKFCSREEAIDAEKLAIIMEKPLFNKQHNKKVEVVESDICFISVEFLPKLFADKDVSSYDLKLLFYLISKINNNNYVKVDAHLLANKLNTSSTTINKSVNKLEKLGVVKRTPTGVVVNKSIAYK